jgi:hypothetical protein
MPDVVSTERVFPQPTVTYVTDRTPAVVMTGGPGCRTLVAQIYDLAQPGVDPVESLDRIKRLIEDWRAAA